MTDYIQIIKDQWLSEIFEHDVFRLVINELPQENDLNFHRAISNYLEKMPVFIYTKIPVNAIACIHGLETVGFHLVDTNILFEKQIANDNFVSGSTNVRFARFEDKEEVSRIARHNFVHSRFHLDPQIDIEIANTVKANWAMNYFSGEHGDAMVVSHTGDKLSGFLQIFFSEGVMVIDLIAVDKNNRRKNIASDMIKFAENNLDDIEYIRVGTQVANVPSLRLYEKLGFHIVDAAYVLHYHNKSPRKLNK